MPFTSILLIISLLIRFQDAAIQGIEDSNGDKDESSVGGSGQSTFNDEDMDSVSSCAPYTEYSDCAFHYELANLHSNHVINITTDVMLLSTIPLIGLENISIIGHDNPTVNCNNIGGVHLVNCHNCTISGITWERCGNKNDSMPAIEMYNSSNIIIQNCSFQYSVTRVIAIAEMLGNVMINDCRFAFNGHLDAHGIAIYYLSKLQRHSQLQFTIANCNFTHNSASLDKSLVYISPSNNKFMEQMYFTNSVFFNNQGTSIYVSHQNVFASGVLLFEENEANNGGGIFITNHSTVMFQNSNLKFINNKARYDAGALYMENTIAIFEDSSTLTVNSNRAMRYGGALVLDNSDLLFEGNSAVKVNNTYAAYGGAFFIIGNSHVTFAGDATVKINKSMASQFGGAIVTYTYSTVTFEGNSTVTISNSQASYGGAVFSWHYCNITFKGDSTVSINNNVASRDAGALLVWNKSRVTFEARSTVRISNSQGVFAGAIFIFDNSHATCKENSSLIINNSQASSNGGAFYAFNNSHISFEGNSTVTLNNNQAYRGGAITGNRHSFVTFKGNSIVTINNNQATESGGALYVYYETNILFKDYSMVIINDNKAGNSAGGLSAYGSSNLTFEGNCMVTIINNKARIGGGVYIWDNLIVFKGTSRVIINNNYAAENGGAFYIERLTGLIMFEENCTVTINNNDAAHHGGGIYIWEKTYFIAKGNSAITVNSNRAANGGALYILDNSFLILKENCTANLYNNAAIKSGGALYVVQNCNVSFEDNSSIVFYCNTAGANGGALYAEDNCNLISAGNSMVTFNNSEVLNDGGAIYVSCDSNIWFKASSTVTLNDNKARYFGGAIRSNINSSIKFEGNCTILFNHNEASQGGAIFLLHSAVFRENSIIQFSNNNAIFGGALYVSYLIFKENTVVGFMNNKALQNGGALYSDNSNITMKQKSIITFTNNGAENGGAIFASSSILLVSEYSSVTFSKNTAKQDGGAIYFNYQINASFENLTTVTLTSNNANNHGGAIYSKVTQDTQYLNISEITFSSNNSAKVGGRYLYVDVSKSCNRSCLNNRVVGFNNETMYQDSSGRKFSTSPGILKLYDIAKCITIDNDTFDCENYYINNIMLGQEIIIYPCILDYYSKPAEVTQFRIIGASGNHQNYFIHGSEFTSISCNHKIEGISVIGNKSISTSPLNYSLLFTSYTTSTSERKIISVNLTVELTPCHPGFQYDSKSQRCECYNTSGIVSCSGSTSAIQRGYWFGHVTGTPAITFCPISYCNFTCCKTNNGYYHLSPVRVNQCKSHRSGTACGSCEKDHTLSYDSAECISDDKCKTGLIILVVAITVMYWFVVVTAVFFLMYYKVSIGHLYAVTYYYSIVDIILSQQADISNGLYITNTIFSSIAKVTPQFLGQFCLFKNMSGIDQQFIHYVHPLAVLVILIIISWSTRHSKKLSMFISRSIIHAICFLMLLSYTSVATTSLLLMRSLTFVDVDKVYTYLSPDIQYFHGRHLAYGIVAIILALLIVFGLPLLLLLEPFLNSKINFFRIKPFLDQFQGCYKDRCRWFAAYYMICRLVLISVIIVDFSETFISRYLLITVSVIIALIHLVVKPYADYTLNIFDGAILQLMILVTALPVFEQFDTFDSTLVVGIAFLLLSVPLLLFIVMNLFITKESVKKATKNIIECCNSSFQNKTHKDKPVATVNDNSLSKEFDLIVDNNMRHNTTIVEIPFHKQHLEDIGCRDSFMDALKEIEDLQ